MKFIKFYAKYPKLKFIRFNLDKIYFKQLMYGNKFKLYNNGNIFIL